MDEPRATGRCLCGAVSYVVTGPLRDVLNCHCHRCRRFTGHHMAATSAAVADLALDDPAERLTWFHPVAEAGYAFCARCGSSLFWRGDDPERWSICAGTLDPPTGAWWTAEAGDYHRRPDLPEWDREP